MKLLATATFLFAASVFAAPLQPASPESQGVDSQGILDWLDAVEKTFDGGKLGTLHGFVIVRHGFVVAEGTWKPFETLKTPHMLYSHSKSFTSTAIGFLVDDGKLDLDERIVDLFPEQLPAQPSDNLKALRVRDLLTMNLGSNYNDAERKDPNGDWISAMLKNPIENAPGTKFHYNSGATYLLSAIVELKSGKPLMDFLKERLFDKIGITQAWSTTCPRGIACGGWGMNMTTRELARFGQFYLQRGEWDGEQLLSGEWIDLATARQTWSNGFNSTKKVSESKSDWQQGYGFKFWRCRHGAYRADGASGQYTIVMPKEDAVVCVHAGVGDMQKELDLIWDHLLPAFKQDALPEDATLNAKLEHRLANLAYAPVAGKKIGLSEFLGRTITLAKNTGDYKSVKFDQTPEGWNCSFETRAGMQSIPLGYGKWATGKIKIDTEKHESLGAYIGEFDTAGSAAIQEDGSFKAKIYLPTTPGYFEFTVNGRVGSITLNGQFKAMNPSKLVNQPEK